MAVEEEKKNGALPLRKVQTSSLDSEISEIELLKQMLRAMVDQNNALVTNLTISEKERYLAERFMKVMKKTAEFGLTVYRLILSVGPDDVGELEKTVKELINAIFSRDIKFRVKTTDDSFSPMLSFGNLVVTEKHVSPTVHDEIEIFVDDDLEKIEKEAYKEQLMVIAEVINHWTKWNYQSDKDKQTGAMSKSRFNKDLVSFINLSRRHNRSFSIVCFDLNGLKSINDNYGHDQGDRAIHLLVKTIVDHKRPEDIVYRTGTGDEFTVLLPETKSAGAKAFAKRVQEELKRCFIEADSDRHTITTSVGYATYPNSLRIEIAKSDLICITAMGLFKAADMCLYHEKNKSREDR